MNPRLARRLAALMAVTAGATTIAAAATKRRHDAGFLGVEWAANVVIGGRYGLLICGVALVVLVRGLLHGKRTAHRLALVAAVVAAVSLHPRGIGVVALAALAMLGALLGVGRQAFCAGSDPARARRGWWILVAGETTVLLYGVVGVYLLDREFRQSTTIVGSALSSVRLLFLLPGPTVSPVTSHGGFLLDSVRVASFAVAIAGLVSIVATVVAGANPDEDDRRTTEDLLDRWATNGLAPFVLADDKNWWFADDRSAVLAYKVVGRTAVVLGEPIGSPAGCLVAARGFLEFCDGNGWTVGFHQVTAAGRETLARAGLRSLKIGENAVIPVNGFDLSAPQHKSLRSALRRVERAGCRVVALPQPIDAPTMDALREVSDAWLSSSGHRERTFTLGQFDPDRLRSTTVLAVVSANDAIVAFVSLLPTYRSINGNFDLMRRGMHAPNGAMEALFVAMIERCRALGLEGLDLGMAPFANVDEGSIAGRALRAAYEGGRSMFNFDGLRAFKQKWDPVWECRYICYQADADLPTLAAAIVRAGELPDSRSPVGRLRGLVRRFPVALSITTVQVYVMAATNWSADLHRQLIRHFALGWHDLVHVQLWRLVTSPFVQDRPGFAWGNLLVLVPVLFIAERRFGSQWTAALFILGDALSTLGVLVGARLAGTWGNVAALHAALQRDGGSSSAGFALVAACAASIRRRRARVSAVVGLVVVLGIVAATHRAEADVQHFLAAVCGAGLVAVYNRRTATP
jgi:phosphatidylglycerol lysyltransferase